ncbi:hypothetical protein HMPREF9141_1686 [Prevotella multiformis DSM 16608]|uniref:Uncharacterized protein n=1 Tax=Prevotella multiformis DSM 16608 TaxID=888743 RepID=F0F7W9_9BACT|nr:hypothetical protein HMPREF9141_1686 [Prevotella multiformis DSM 16608]
MRVEHQHIGWKRQDEGIPAVMTESEWLTDSGKVCRTAIALDMCTLNRRADNQKTPVSPARGDNTGCTPPTLIQSLLNADETEAVEGPESHHGNANTA